MKSPGPGPYYPEITERKIVRVEVEVTAHDGTSIRRDQAPVEHGESGQLRVQFPPTTVVPPGGYILVRWFAE